MNDEPTHRWTWVSVVSGAVFLSTFMVSIGLSHSAARSAGWMIAVGVLLAISVVAGLLGGTWWLQATVTAADRRDIILWPVVPVVGTLGASLFGGLTRHNWRHLPIWMAAALAIALVGYSAHFLGRAISRRRKLTADS